MSERTNERDVGVGGETSALNFREDTHTGGTNERTNERRGRAIERQTEFHAALKDELRTK